LERELSSTKSQLEIEISARKEKEERLNQIKNMGVDDDDDDKSDKSDKSDDLVLSDGDDDD